MKKYNNLDGLRSLAAIGVLCMHVYANIDFKISGEYTGYLINSLIAQFGAFVQLFFIISGFGMCCGYYEKIKTGKINLNVFYSKRYGKILPFFALLVFADLAVALVFSGGITKENLYEAFADLTLMYGFFATFDMSVIGVGWTLGVIFGFYILFPFYVYLIWNKRRAWFSLVVALGIWHVSNAYFATAGSLCMQWLCYFLAGGLLYLYQEEISRWMRTPAVGILIRTIGFMMVYLVTVPNGVPMVDLLCTCKNLSGFSMMVMGAMGPDTVLWSNPVSRFISSTSLEIYLAHMLIFRMIEKLRLTQIFGETTASYVFACLLTVIGVLVFAVIYQRTEEKIRKILSC